MDSQKLTQQFLSDGYLYLPGFLSRTQVDEINETLAAFIQHQLSDMAPEHVKYEVPGDPGSLKMLQDLQAYSPLFERLLLDSSFSQLAETVLGEQVVGKTLEYFNKPAKIGKATPPHQDGYYFMLEPMSAVTMWLALEEVDEQNGWVSYVKGSHKKGMRPHGATQTVGFSQGIVDFGQPSDLEDEVFFPAKPGDLLLHHALTIHRAAPNTHPERSRKAMGWIYFGKSAKEDVEAKQAYVKSLNKKQA
ncbi:phytanoyl-CoA dioxygenase family protein [Cyclobacterium jeungdonense]|uniref:Phytanoyl-CoA dioxygenase family protein n=1 Tax=Cyclobacterium jeungdonense TaxID=708087 RepID=A0ABT8C7K5_9BACT|nr:phytanoyl-CoA dioxygenase family protein [Cyclobacterium jeungdonense]MDN3688778.1 phytanoyl-CoA dioxygenase family protein [Cyclobacterium jeungdonense]